MHPAATAVHHAARGREEEVPMRERPDPKPRGHLWQHRAPAAAAARTAQCRFRGREVLGLVALVCEVPGLVVHVHLHGLCLAVLPRRCLQWRGRHPVGHAARQWLHQAAAVEGPHEHPLTVAHAAEAMLAHKLPTIDTGAIAHSAVRHHDGCWFSLPVSLVVIAVMHGARAAVGQLPAEQLGQLLSFEGVPGNGPRDHGDSLLLRLPDVDQDHLLPEFHPPAQLGCGYRLGVGCEPR
mmetsp:Transcript_90622/g.252011  ORF Transcript_90622/g.252011 Transcript_90622/m.252011 type:complete len:237 (-) Transcript_90622:118-828(-)